MRDNTRQWFPIGVALKQPEEEVLLLLLSVQLSPRSHSVSNKCRKRTILWDLPADIAFLRVVCVNEMIAIIEGMGRSYKLWISRISTFATIFLLTLMLPNKRKHPDLLVSE